MADVVIDIVAKDSYSGVLGNFGSIMTGIESVVNLATRAFENLVVPVIDFGKESVLASARVNELRAVNQVLAETAGISSSAVIAAAQAVRDMGIEAGVSEQVIAEFVRANLDIANAADIARIAQDAAVISGINSSEATERIIEGIVKLNPLILRNAGIIVDLQQAYQDFADENDRTTDSLTTAEKQHIAMNAVMEAGEAIAGSYAAAMEEPGKVLRSFPRYFDDIMVAIGAPFQDAFAEVLFVFADLAKWIGSAVEEGGELRPVLDTLALVVGGLADSLAIAVTNLVTFLEYRVSDSPIFQWFQDLLDRSTVVDEVLIGIQDVKDSFEELGTIEPVAIFEIVETLDLDLFKENFKNDLISAVESIDFEEIVNVIDVKMAAAIDNVDWSNAGAAFGSAIGGVLGQAFSKENLTNIFTTESGDIDWLKILAAPVAALRDVLEYEFFQSASDAVNEFFAGLFAGFNSWSSRVEVRVKNWFADHLINPIKEFLGIASPSTVFYGIGQNIISGLVGGIGSMIQPMLAFLGNVIDLLLMPFEPLLNIIDALTGGDIIGTSDTINWGDGGTPSTGGTVTNNYYFYGNTYLSGVGPDGTYDCIPNPIITNSLPNAAGF